MCPLLWVLYQLVQSHFLPGQDILAPAPLSSFLPGFLLTLLLPHRGCAGVAAKLPAVFSTTECGADTQGPAAAGGAAVPLSPSTMCPARRFSSPHSQGVPKQTHYYFPWFAYLYDTEFHTMLTFKCVCTCKSLPFSSGLSALKLIFLII